MKISTKTLNLLLDCYDHASLTNTITIKHKRDTVHNYKFLASLARGSYGDVFIVQHNITKKIYALKRLNKEKIKKNPNTALYINERNCMIDTRNSTYLLSLHKAFQNKSHCYFLMDFVIGGDLLSMMAKLDTFDESFIRFYTAELILALKELHTLGYLHRDVKPDNILITQGGHIKLGDFGSCVKTVNGIVKSGVSVGTPDYISPEVLNSVNQENEYGCEVDVWSLGVVVYEMVNGTTPFYSHSLVDTYRKITRIEYTHDKGTEELKEVISAMLVGKEKRATLDELMGYAFFKGTNFDDLKACYVPSKEWKINFSDVGFVDDENENFCTYEGFVGFTYDENVEIIDSSEDESIKELRKIIDKSNYKNDKPILSNQKQTDANIETKKERFEICENINQNQTQNIEKTVESVCASSYKDKNACKDDHYDGYNINDVIKLEPRSNKISPEYINVEPKYENKSHKCSSTSSDTDIEICNKKIQTQTENTNKNGNNEQVNTMKENIGEIDEYNNKEETKYMSIIKNEESKVCFTQDANCEKEITEDINETKCESNMQADLRNDSSQNSNNSIKEHELTIEPENNTIINESTLFSKNSNNSINEHDLPIDSENNTIINESKLSIKDDKELTKPVATQNDALHFKEMKDYLNSFNEKNKDLMNFTHSHTETEHVKDENEKIQKNENNEVAICYQNKSDRCLQCDEKDKKEKKQREKQAYIDAKAKENRSLNKLLLKETRNRLQMYTDNVKSQHELISYYVDHLMLQNKYLKKEIRKKESKIDYENIKFMEELKKELRQKKMEIRELEQKVEEEVMMRQRLQDEIKYVKSQNIVKLPEIKREFHCMKVLISANTTKSTIQYKEICVTIEGGNLIIENECDTLNHVYVDDLKEHELYFVGEKKRKLIIKVVFIPSVVSSIGSSTRCEDDLMMELKKENSILEGLTNLLKIVKGKVYEDAKLQQKGSLNRIEQLNDEIARNKSSTIVSNVERRVNTKEFNNHRFVNKTFKETTICYHCNQILYGSFDQGYCCLDCKMITHKSCYILINESCELHKAIKNGRVHYLMMRNIEEKERVLKNIKNA